MEHHAYKNAHPSDDHFVRPFRLCAAIENAADRAITGQVPLYVAAGAGGDGAARVLQANYGIHTYAFGL
jgi:hypothetical protein